MKLSELCQLLGERDVQIYELQKEVERLIQELAQLKAAQPAQ